MLLRNKLTITTIVTNPKSFGESSLAKIIVDIVCIKNDNTFPNIDAVAPFSARVFKLFRR
jgi:hypothetical protein